MFSVKGVKRACVGDLAQSKTIKTRAVSRLLGGDVMCGQTSKPMPNASRSRALAENVEKRHTIAARLVNQARHRFWGWRHRWPGPPGHPSLYNTGANSPCEDLEQCCYIVQCLQSPQGCFYAHTVQGGGGSRPRVQRYVHTLVSHAFI